MPYCLPQALQPGADPATAPGYLRTYYGKPYNGSYFDSWPSTDHLRFTADDFVAVSFLSVFVPPMAARQLLDTRADHFARLLEAIGPDTDLRDEQGPIDPHWPVWQLYAELRHLPGIGPTIASKLCARKRPRLVPIYDSVVARVTDCYKRQWEPLRQQLRDNGLNERLMSLRDEAALPESLSPLRVYDVITWMEGKAQPVRRTAEEERGDLLADPPAEDFSALDDEDARDSTGTSN